MPHTDQEINQKALTLKQFRELTKNLPEETIIVFENCVGDAIPMHDALIKTSLYQTEDGFLTLIKPWLGSSSQKINLRCNKIIALNNEE